MIDQDDEFMTPGEVAKRLKVNERTVAEWLRTGLLAGAKFGRFWRISKSSLNQFIRRSAVKYIVQLEEPMSDRLPRIATSDDYLWRFLATPAESYGTPIHDESTKRFAIRLQVSRSLLSCGEWPKYADKPKALAPHLFAFIQERIQADGIHFGTEWHIEQLGTWTDDGRFTMKPPYSVKFVDMTRPFEAYEAGAVPA